MTQAESFMEVYGYLGENITLNSGADPSSPFSKIEWSVFSNDTWIATYDNGIKIIEHFNQYKGRLSLNTLSGKKKYFKVEKLLYYYYLVVIHLFLLIR